MARRSAFWKTSAVLLRFKPQLAGAAVGVGISALSFGAGLGLTVPLVNLFFKDGQNLPTIVERYLGDPKRWQWLQEVSAWLVPRLPEEPFYGLLLTFAALVVLSIIGAFGRYLHELLSISVALKAALIWRERLFCRLLHAPLAYTLEYGVADHKSRLIVDVTHLLRAYRAILSTAVRQIVTSLAAVVIAFMANWMLTVMALLGTPVIAILLNRFGRVIRRATRRLLQQHGRLLGVLSETFSATPVVKAYSAEGFERRRFRQVNRQVLNEQMRARQADALSSPVIDTVTLTGVLAVAAAAGWYVFVQNPDADRSLFTLAVVSLIGAGLSIKPLTRLNNHLKEAEAAAERILHAASLPIEPIEPAVRAAQPAPPRHQRDVIFEHVTFRYPGQEPHERPAVNDVSMRVEHGQTVAIVGGNGSGKTTLLHMLPRLLEPQTGRVLIDSVDIAGVNLRALREQMAIVTQQSVLFQGTIANNIAYGRAWEPREKIVAAARAAFADEFITALPRGYDTVLGEHGSGLSGGQRQRLCIARAILRDPAILILDEATSQIDADSEAKINQAVRRFRQGRTVFVIAHRLSTVIDADRIAVMHDGRIVDQGTHDDLLARSEHYRLLAQHQLQAARPASAPEMAI